MRRNPLGPTRRMCLSKATCCLLILSAIPVFARTQDGPPASSVITAPLVEREIPATQRLVGTVMADRRAVVASEIGGIVVKVAAEEGDFVRAGGPLAELDAVPAKLRHDEAAATWASLQSKLDELRNGERPEMRRRLSEALEEAKAMQSKWHFERERLRRLYSDKLGNEKEVHDTEMETNAADRRVGMAEAALTMAEAGGRAEERARAEADVAAQQAVVARLAREVEKTVIRAPFDGFVTAKRVELGEYIMPGGPVCEFVAIERVRIRFDVPEAAIATAQTGAPVTIEIEALGATRSATIARIIPRAADAARTFPVEAELPNEDHRVLPGMFVWAHVPVGASAKRLMISKDAIVADGPRKQVFVIRSGPDGKSKMAIPVSVQTGLEVGTEIELRGPGLVAGDEVVVRANERFFGPTPVIPTPAASQPATMKSAPSTNTN